jgi:hypothetical protein
MLVRKMVLHCIVSIPVNGEGKDRNRLNMKTFQILVTEIKQKVTWHT